MDEFQFIESLDALLANETLDESTTAAADFANTSISPVHGQGILSTSTSATWLSGNDNSLSRSDPFAMPLHSNQGYAATAASTVSQPATAYPQYTTTYIDPQQQQQQQQTQKALGPMVPSASPAAPIASSVSVAPSAVASVCSANSRGSSNASASRRRSGVKSNNSISGGSAGSKGAKAGSRKRARGTSMAVSDSEDESSRRRHDRNLREQRRSQKITNQIDQLREVLAAASVRFKPDKYSTLVSVVEYVKQLQRRSTMLDMEHKKLLDTITKTNEMVNAPYTGNTGAAAASTAGDANGSKPDSVVSGANNNGNGVASGGQGDIYNDDELVFVRNVDYKCIFERCGMPLAVASIDGRLMDCNQEFVKLTGYRRDELLPNEAKQQKQQQNDDETFSPNSIFPDGPTSSNSNTGATNATTGSTARSNKNSNLRNFSLFNLLSRENMEQVFVSLSEMLKQPPKEESGTNMVSNNDYWSGNVRLSRNTHIEVRSCHLSSGL